MINMLHDTIYMHVHDIYLYAYPQGVHEAHSHSCVNADSHFFFVNIFFIIVTHLHFFILFYRSIDRLLVSFVFYIFSMVFIVYPLPPCFFHMSFYISFVQLTHACC